LRPARSGIARFPRSIRTRLMLWNVCALALILAILGGIVRHVVETNLLDAVDRALTERARHLPGMRRPPPRPPEQPPFPPGGLRRGGPPDRPDFRLPGPMGPPGMPGPPGGIPPPRPRGEEGSALWPRLLNREGKALLPFEKTSPWNEPAFRKALQGQESHITIVSDGEALRIYSQPIWEEGAIIGVAQVAYPMAEVRRALTGVDSALLALIPVALLLAGAGGALLTDRALRPVRRITQTAEQIGAQDLSRRLPVVGADEFAQLSATFNGMLARLQAAFAQKEELVRQLEALVEQQRRFTGDASHELRTPLTIVKANTSLLLRSQPTEAEYREATEDIDRAADRMTRLVQDLLLLTRSDGGQLGRNAVVLSVAEVLEQAAQGARKPDAAPIYLEVAEPSPSVRGNPDEIVRLFANLLENAVRYTPAEGEIRVTARSEGENVVIRVRDTGIGIAAEHLPHLCERFYRVDAARSRPDGGTGLGLAICKSIVEAHRGTLRIESAVGKGTTVSVTLPRA